MEALSFRQDASAPAVRPSELPQRSPRRLGEILTERGDLTYQQLRLALLQKYRSGAPLGEVLVQTGVISERALARALAEQWSLETVDLTKLGPGV